MSGSSTQRLLVTGGSGFIGSALILHLMEQTEATLLNLDKLTYAGNPDSLKSIENQPRYQFRKVDICDRSGVDLVMDDFKPTGILHLAAESHVDRSIEGSREFIETNIIGTHTLLESSLAYWRKTSAAVASEFRFLHVSTDEVYGHLGDTDPGFTEKTPYSPRSPYSASKASSDHLVRAWTNTYGLPTLITNCSNNYGPRQFPEKLIPHMILNALKGKPLPVYGDGTQIRDWLHVEDFVDALWTVFTKGVPSSTYNIGGNQEMRNLSLVEQICDLLDEHPRATRPSGIQHFRDLITFVTDRPGHDRRYAVDTTKIETELGWRPSHRFTDGLRDTIDWYLNNENWWKRILSGDYQLERAGNHLES